MHRTSLAASTVGLSLCLAAPLGCQSEIGQSGEHQYRIVTVVEDLDHPWSFTWLPDGDMLITEREGGLRLFRDGALDPAPVPGGNGAGQQQEENSGACRSLAHDGFRLCGCVAYVAVSSSMAHRSASGAAAGPGGGLMLLFAGYPLEQTMLRASSLQITSE